MLDLLRMFIPILLVVIGWVWSTQAFAHSVNDNEKIIGEHLFKIGDTKIFNPFLYLFCFPKYLFNNMYKEELFSSVLYFVCCGLVAFAIAVSWSIIREIMSRSARNIHGTARLATKKDLKENGFLKKEGVVCAELANARVKTNKEEDSSIKLKLQKPSDLVCHTGTINTLLLAPTGSGKGVSVIMPTLLSYKESMIIFDPKGENYNKTAGWRSTFSHVIKFAPCSKQTIRFNPVMAIKDGDGTAFRDCNLIASIIFSSGKNNQDETSAYFSNTAKDLVTTALMHIRFSDYPDKSLRGLLRFLTGGEEDAKPAKNPDESQQGVRQFQEAISSKHYFKFLRPDGTFVREEATKLHKIIVNGAIRAINMNPKEKASVFSTIFSKIQLFEDPLLAEATSGTDFEIEDFIHSDLPISLYLTVPYSDVERIAPVFKLLISFMLKKFSEGETSFGEVRLKNHLLFLLDEFPILGCFPDIAQVMGVLRGYGINFLIVCQALNQLVDIYGQNHPFLDHCPLHIVFAPGQISDAEMYCKSIGSESIHQEKVSRNGKRFGNIGGLTFSDNDMGRNLLDAADIKRIPGNKCLIMAHGMQPYIASKVVYYQDKRFCKKLDYKAPQGMTELYAQISDLPSRVRMKKEKEDYEKKPIIEEKGSFKEIEKVVEGERHLILEETSDLLEDEFEEEAKLAYLERLERLKTLAYLERLKSLMKQKLNSEVGFKMKDEDAEDSKDESSDEALSVF